MEEQANDPGPVRPHTTGAPDTADSRDAVDHARTAASPDAVVRADTADSPDAVVHADEVAVPDRRRVVVLAGPSGAGKSRLADRLNAARGWPVFRLDDFYRDEDDPAMPRRAELDIVDWDHPDSWDGARAVATLSHLLDTGRCATPVYDIARSRAVGTREVTAGPDDLVLAEGIFAAEVVAPLRAAGMLHSAWCVHHRPAVTFARRLARDLAERRKPPPVLLRRGWRLMREEPGIVARQTALGATGSRAAAVERALLG